MVNETFLVKIRFSVCVLLPKTENVSFNLNSRGIRLVFHLRRLPTEQMAGPPLFQQRDAVARSF